MRAQGTAGEVRPRAGGRCAFCGDRRTTIVRTETQISTDLQRALARGDKLMHSYAAAVFACVACRTVFRDPGRVPDDLPSRYRDDCYPAPDLERLRARGLFELRRQKRTLAALGLRPDSTILEIGSYAGSFLTYAGELGCDATGVDIGRTVVAFARAHGLEVLDQPFSAGRLGGRRFDSVWILNCFEQLPDSRAVLGEVAAVLRPEGRVVIRTPNADFIRAAYRYECRTTREMLDANGLLGVPFVKCLNPEGIVRLLADRGFGRFVLRGHELGSASPPGYPAWWSALRTVRTLAYELASRRANSLLYPWIDVSGALEP
jgi:SAM-dependent methyltransferase